MIRVNAFLNDKADFRMSVEGFEDQLNKQYELQEKCINKLVDMDFLYRPVFDEKMLKLAIVECAGGTELFRYDWGGLDFSLQRMKEVAIFTRESNSDLADLLECYVGYCESAENLNELDEIQSICTKNMKFKRMPKFRKSDYKVFETAYPYSAMLGELIKHEVPAEQFGVVDIAQIYRNIVSADLGLVGNESLIDGVADAEYKRDVENVMFRNALDCKALPLGNNAVLNQLIEAGKKYAEDNKVDMQVSASSLMTVGYMTHISQINAEIEKQLKGNKPLCVTRAKIYYKKE